MGTLNYLGIFNMAIKSALVQKKKKNKLTKTLGRCSVANVWCLGFDIKTNNSQNSCGSLGAWIKESCQFFCLTGFHKHRAHLSKGLSRLTFLQPAILLLFHFNLTSSSSTCSYPLWSPLHFCYSCRTFAPQQYHFTLFLPDAPAHYFYVIQHLYLNQIEIHSR